MLGEKVTEIMNGVLDKVKHPAELIPPLLLECVTLRRPGLSPSKIAAEIISNNALLGIPTGVNEDGSMNLLNAYTYNVVKCIVDAIKEDAVVQVAIPKNTVSVRTYGANAGGPVVSIGTNIISSVLRGLMR